MLTAYQLRLVVWVLLFASVGNAWYTMTRSRHYRLFEANVEQAPQTPSAKRVRVQCSPVSSSPLRLLTDLIVPESAEERSHPDKTRDVWELSVWDPLPLCLRIFCVFSPGHVLVYMMFVPLAPLDPRPSVTVANCIILQMILSVQLLYLQSRFSRQAKDMAIIHKEVFNEYDTKFVRPRLHPVVRDVGTQFKEEDSGVVLAEQVETGTPTTMIKREFQTHANPNYKKHIDPDYDGSTHMSNVMSPRLFTPAVGPRYSDSLASAGGAAGGLRSSAYRQSLPAQASSPRASSPPIAPPTPAVPTPANTGVAATTGFHFGGSMGVYTHANSPLRKATSVEGMNVSRVMMGASPRNSRELAAMEQQGGLAGPQRRGERQGSPLKNEKRVTSNPFSRPPKSDFERYPSRLW